MALLCSPACPIYVVAMREPLKVFLEGFPPPADAPMTEVAPDMAFSTVVTLAPGYVWPDVVLDAPDLQSTVVLLSAPGAMGKSAAARAIATTLNCPLVDLARLRVGSNSLTGLLTQVLGWGQAPTFIQALQAGTATLVLDGLDEALLAAGRDNFQAFLGDVARLLTDAVGVGQVVLLGRPDAVASTEVGLSLVGLTGNIVRIAPLDETQASQLIDVTLDAKVVDGKAFTVHRVHRGPFGQLRARLYQNIATALTGEATWMPAGAGWQEVEGFLGYPPVLLALAERLTVHNPSQELSRAVQLPCASGASGTQGGLLRGIVESVLDREALKVQGQMSVALCMPSEDRRRVLLYTREEQVLRLLRHVTQVDFDIAAPAALEPAERALYEDHVGDFIPDHPFLLSAVFSNVVFSDFARAFAVTSPAQPLLRAHRQQVLGALPDVGPFLASFVHSLSALDGGGSNVPEDLVSDLLRSNSAASRGGGSAVYQHRGNQATLDLFSDVVGARFVAGGGVVQHFHISEPTGVLELQSPITRVLVMTEHGLVLTGSTGTFTAGPGVLITAENIEINAESFEAIGLQAADKQEIGCLIIADTEVDHNAKLRVAAHPSDYLLVSWPRAWHQWKPYLFAPPEAETLLHSKTSQHVLLGIRRILTGFGASAADNPSAYCDKFERFAVGENPLFKATLASLMNLGVVERTGALYRLKLDVLARFGVSYAKLRGPEFASTLSKLLTEVSKDSALRELDANTGP